MKQAPHPDKDGPMPKWIDLKVRRPKHGQLVVVSTPKPGSTTEVHLEICTFGTSQDWRFPPELNATRWYPLPAIREEPIPNPHRGIINEELRATCIKIEHELIERAPLINWKVTPAFKFMTPNGTTDSRAWKIEGSVDIGGFDIATYNEIDDYQMRNGAIDMIGYVIHQVATAIAWRLVRVNDRGMLK